MYVQIAVREAKRQNLAYREHSIRALGRYAAARTDKDLSDAVHDVVGPVLEDLCRQDAGDEEGDKMDVDDGGSAVDERR